MYDYIKVYFKLRRKWLYCLINIKGPVVLSSVLNIVCFQLPAESGEKVTLSISIVSHLLKSQALEILPNNHIYIINTIYGQLT